MPAHRPGTLPAPNPLPNIITTARLAAIPLLAWLAWRHHPVAFAWALALCFASDALDGWLARATHSQTEVGALLDTLSQLALMLVIGFALLEFQPALFAAQAQWLLLVPTLWAAQSLTALLRFRHAGRMRTWLSRAATFGLAVFALTLFIAGFSAPMLALAVALVVLAFVEALVLMALLPQWRDEVPGLWSVLRERRRAPP